MKDQTSAAPLRLCLAVALCTLATLLLELSLTRIFSVVLFYHFAFVAISVALFGLGVGGVAAYYMPAVTDKESTWSQLGGFCTKNALLVVVTLLLVISRPLFLAVTWMNALQLAVVYIVCALPFLIAGVVVSLAISKTVKDVSRVYYYDLIGAAVGCLMLVPLLDWVGGPGTVIMAGAFFALAGALWHSLVPGSGRRVKVSIGLATALVLFVVVNRDAHIIDVHYAKGGRIQGEDYVQWNSFSRISVGLNENGKHRIAIDSDASTDIAPCDPATMSAEERQELVSTGPILPYSVRPGGKALIIGAGGGQDVCRALVTGSSDITAVEINPIIVRDVMMERYADASKGLYLRPEVRVAVEDGRSYIRRVDESFDVIQMTLVDSWASTASGAFALAENHLYTEEAFRDYLEHLSPDGVLAITRWEFEQPRESLRVVSLGLAALRQMGADEPNKHFVIAREDIEDLSGWGARDTILIKRNPFTEQELANARGAIEEYGLTTIYASDDAPANLFTDFLHSKDPVAFASNYLYDISPVSDDRPFFFYTWRGSHFWDAIWSRTAADAKINLGVMLLFVSLGLAVLGVVVILVMPILLLKQQIPRERPLWFHLFYFLSIGMGFILVEIAFVQRIALYLGQPTYALTVVIFSLLISSGAGSYMSRRVVGGRDGRLMILLSSVAVLTLILILVTPGVLDSSLALPLAAKLALVVLLLTPIGFLMGMPFPSGLGRLEKRYPQAVCWAWAVNAAASVLGSVGAIFLAIHIGLGLTMLVGGVCYLGALTAILLTPVAEATEAKAVPADALVATSG